MTGEACVFGMVEVRLIFLLLIIALGFVIESLDTYLFLKKIMKARGLTPKGMMNASLSCKSSQEPSAREGIGLSAEPKIILFLARYSA